ncbi:MAG: hypothetical protein WBC75_01615 [Dehalococcoidales bacterium]
MVACQTGSEFPPTSGTLPCSESGCLAAARFLSMSVYPKNLIRADSGPPREGGKP